MSISSITSGSAAALASLQSAKPAGGDNDGDNDNDATESASVKASEAKGPLPVGGSVGHSVDISA
ncbi:hypothetical protein [Ferrovibrio xuzhouensis]|uniref:Secreted protein n=1 Tax=Ferrovibrio xuzhouensis TaxID=1576914 RepID=A0ABV7VHC8_9PROT